MSGFGMGIGSFMEGLASGIRSGQAIASRNRSDALDERRLQILEEEARRKADDDVFERDYKNRNMRLLEEQNRRADEEARRKADTDAYNRSISEKNAKWAEEDRTRALSEHSADRAWSDKQHSWSEQDRARQEAERAANAPLVETTRKAAILDQENKLKDAGTEASIRSMSQQGKAEYDKGKEKSILAVTGADGKPAFSVDGETVSSREDAEKLYEQRHGSFMDNYYKVQAPKIMEAYIANGQPEKAEQFRKYLEADQGRKTVEIGGRIMQSYLLGDMDGVNKHINQLIRGGKYMVTDGYDVKAEPLKDKDGNTVGLRGVFKNKETGEKFNRDYTGDQLSEMISGLSNPSVLFEHGIQTAEALRARAAEERKKGIETGADIMKEDAKADAALRLKILEGLDAQNSSLGSSKMSPEQMQAEFNRRYNMVKNAGKSVSPSAGGGGVPTLTWGPGR